MQITNNKLKIEKENLEKILTKENHVIILKDKCEKIQNDIKDFRNIIDFCKINISKNSNEIFELKKAIEK
jgi:hypothetical protein